MKLTKEIYLNVTDRLISNFFSNERWINKWVNKSIKKLWLCLKVQCTRIEDRAYNKYDNPYWHNMVRDRCYKRGAEGEKVNRSIPRKMKRIKKKHFQYWIDSAIAYPLIHTPCNMARQGWKDGVEGAACVYVSAPHAASLAAAGRGDHTRKKGKLLTHHRIYLACWR